jgi:hypothetical protein
LVLAAVTGGLVLWSGSTGGRRFTIVFTATFKAILEDRVVIAIASREAERIRGTNITSQAMGREIGLGESSSSATPKYSSI